MKLKSKFTLVKDLSVMNNLGLTITRTSHHFAQIQFLFEK